MISALLGHATPIIGFGAVSRMTPGYAHATWAMVMVVAVLEQPSPLKQTSFAADEGIQKEGRKGGLVSDGETTTKTYKIS
ncbi:MAG: hypothetical protein QOI77_1170 [Blastocatellia bacterium]|nr:hypothetical protein [Blastocatellia bacterium]